jgi:hypothetical protein
VPQADLILNLVWAALCLSAAGAFVCAERSRHAGKRSARALAIFLCAVALFPCVSASDDSVCLQFFNAGEHSRHPGPAPEKSQAGLVRALEALESVQVPLIWALAVVLCFFALVLIRSFRSLDRFAPHQAGRGPPLPLLASFEFSL